MIKTPQDSYTEQVHLVLQSTMNGTDRLYGGQLMEWIDSVAAVVARRHANKIVTTALVDKLEFKEPAQLNSLVVMQGKIVYAGTTSMEVSVKTFVEHLDGSRLLINSARLIMVAIDEKGRPTKVPGLEPQTEDEKRHFIAAQKRAQRRKEKLQTKREAEALLNHTLSE